MGTEIAAPAYRRIERLPWRRLDHQIVIVNPRNRAVHVLNGTGSVIWELLDDKRTIDELTRSLSRRFEGDPALVVQQVSAFLQDLTGKGLVEIEGASDVGAE